MTKLNVPTVFNYSLIAVASPVLLQFDRKMALAPGFVVPSNLDYQVTQGALAPTLGSTGPHAGEHWPPRWGALLCCPPQSASSS